MQQQWFSCCNAYFELALFLLSFLAHRLMILVAKSHQCNTLKGQVPSKRTSLYWHTQFSSVFQGIILICKLKLKLIPGILARHISLGAYALSNTYCHCSLLSCKTTDA